MKSFDKFQHERTDLLEVKIFKKMSSTGVSPNAGNNPGLRKTAETGRQLDPRRALPSSPTKLSQESPIHNVQHFTSSRPLLFLWRGRRYVG